MPRDFMESERQRLGSRASDWLGPTGWGRLAGAEVRRGGCGQAGGELLLHVHREGWKERPC